MAGGRVQQRAAADGRCRAQRVAPSSRKAMQKENAAPHGVDPVAPDPPACSERESGSQAQGGPAGGCGGAEEARRATTRTAGRRGTDASNNTTTTLTRDGGAGDGVARQQRQQQQHDARQAARHLQRGRQPAGGEREGGRRGMQQELVEPREAERLQLRPGIPLPPLRCRAPAVPTKPTAPTQPLKLTPPAG